MFVKKLTMLHAKRKLAKLCAQKESLRLTRRERKAHAFVVKQITKLLVEIDVALLTSKENELLQRAQRSLTIKKMLYVLNRRCSDCIAPMLNELANSSFVEVKECALALSEQLDFYFQGNFSQLPINYSSIGNHHVRHQIITH